MSGFVYLHGCAIDGRGYRSAFWTRRADAVELPSAHSSRLIHGDRCTVTGFAVRLHGRLHRVYRSDREGWLVIQAPEGERINVSLPAVEEVR